jgi:hypothetical protein
MWLVIFVLGKPQRSEDATKKKHHGDDEFHVSLSFFKITPDLPKKLF